MPIARTRFRFDGPCWFVATALVFLTSAEEGRGQRRPSNPATPSPPHERMSVFEGTWSMEPGADFKGGTAPPVSHEETCAWLAGGRRHIVCRSWRTGVADTTRRESMYILSYRGADSTYVAHHAFASGANLVYHGRPEGDRWVMNLQPGPRWPANERLRTIITVLPGGGLRFVEEHSTDGGLWTITEDYRYRRVR